MFVDVIKQDRKKYKEQGKLEGIKQGVQQGVQQGVNLVAKNMIKNGLDFQLISTVTGLNIQEIEKISKE
jgi:predicted transposase/invertase (TIGR01784 family)